MARPKTKLDDHMAKQFITEMGYTSWQELIIREMGQGASRQEVKELLGMSNDLFTRFMAEEPEFSETIKRGDQSCEAWWLSQGRKNLTNKEFSPTLWYMNMKNRFAWRDKTETDVTTKGEKITGLADATLVDAFIDKLKDESSQRKPD